MTEKIDDVARRIEEQIQNNKQALGLADRMEATQHYRKLSYESEFGEPMV